MSKKNVKNDPKAEELNGKVQTSGQDDASNVSTKVDAPKSGTPEIKEFEEPKSAINTKNAAEVVTAGSDSSGIGGLRRGAITFSGSAGQTQGDISATTKEDKPYKSGDRAGRRADPITRKIDLIDAEIIKTKRYQSKPLCEADGGVGYNGNYENEHVITQKNSGGSPADPMFERSIDMIPIDMLYWTTGQMNVGKNTKKISIHSWDETANNYVGGYEANPTQFSIGNYLARSLTVKIGLNQGVAEIQDFAFDVHDCSVPFVDEATYRLAGDAFLRELNQRELDRNVMISKAGNESDPSWSCLGDAITDASDQNRLLAILDSFAGNFTGVSTRKLNQGLSHQINKAAKDGARITGPMAEMVNGCIPLAGYGADGTVSEANGRDRCFSPDAYVLGGAGLWLATNDSLPKYTTKGKLLSLPLSFKSALSIAYSNMGPLVADDLLFKDIKSNELYSTIDGPYDPVKPVCITDKIGLVTPLPIDICKTGTIFNTTTKELEDTIYVLHYENLRNRYNIRIRNYFVAGLFRWFKERASRLYDACKSKAQNNVVTINIPIVSSGTCISLWDLIVCSSVPYVVEERLITMTELLKYERNHGYPYTGKIHLQDIDVKAADNYTNNMAEEEISVGVAKPISAMKVILPEVFWPIKKKNAEEPISGHNGKAAYTVLPFYFVQNQFGYDKQADDANGIRKLVLSDEGATCAYPTTRSGNMFSYLDTIYGMSEEDYRLALDRMVVYPGYQPSYPNKNKIAGVAHTSNTPDEVFDALTYKYGMTADGTPVIPYFAYADNASNKEDTLTVADIIATPRELGLHQVAPAGLLTPISNGNALNLVSPTSSYLGLSGPGFRAIIYHGVGNAMTNTVLDAGSINIAANASFRNQWEVVDATPYGAVNFDGGFKLRATVSSNAMSPFVTGSYDLDNNGTYDANTGIYNTAEVKDSTTSVASVFKYMWTRLQRLPFIICPFDCNGADMSTSASSWTAINNHDIYDLLYIFGFAGFRASDYKETVYLRSKERIAKGMNYVTDPFVAKTMLLK